MNTHAAPGADSIPALTQDTKTAFLALAEQYGVPRDIAELLWMPAFAQGRIVGALRVMELFRDSGDMVDAERRFVDEVAVDAAALKVDGGIPLTPEDEDRLDAIPTCP
jgi:hypothetical protein